MNEAEAVNAQRDAQRAGEMGTILDTSVRLGAYTFSDALWPQNATTLNADVKKFTANIYRNLNAKYEVGHPIAKEWEQPDPITSPVRSLHEMGRGKSADRPEYPVDLPDCFRVLEGYRERIAYLERQRDALEICRWMPSLSYDQVSSAFGIVAVADAPPPDATISPEHWLKVADYRGRGYDEDKILRYLPSLTRGQVSAALVVLSKREC